MKQWLLAPLVAIGLAFLPAVSGAAPITGSINSGNSGGMTASESWAGGNATLGWSVEQIGPTWEYTYHWVTGTKALSHLIVEVSGTFSAANILAGTTAGWTLGTFGSAQGNSNPGIPADIYGLKWGGVDTDETFVIVTDRAPMWGDFYAKDGVDGTGSNQNPVFAFNTNYGNCDPTVAVTRVLPGCVLVPDTLTTVGLVPEPSAAWLLAFGLGTFALFGRRLKTS